MKKLNTVQQKHVPYNCLFCLVIAKITCQCHVRSGSVMTKQTDTRFRKRIGDIESTRRRMIVFLSMSVQHPRSISNFQCVSSRIFLTRSNGLSCHSKSIRAFQIRWSHQETHDFETRRCRYTLNVTKSLSDYLRRLQHSKTLSLDQRFELLSCILWRLLDVWTTWSDRYDICVTDWSCMRSVSLQWYFLFSLPRTSNIFRNLSLRQESFLRDFFETKSET